MSEGAEAEAEAVAAAGCLFIQGSTVLAAYNPKYKIWSGIGGKVNPNESITEAAYRETIEELFGFTPSKAIIEECMQTFDFKQPLVRNNYAFIPLSLDLFIHIVYILKAYNYTSPYYINLPTTISDLVHHRRHTQDQEITELKLVDYKSAAQHSKDAAQHSEGNPDISQELLDDCIYYENNR
jgi:ADP-ribose pyrophosphatase YjhB (NUDIX family)